MVELKSVKSIASGLVKETIVEKIKPSEKKEPIINTQDFYTGALSRGSGNVMGQATRAEYINEFIDFWRDDYRAKAKVIAFLALGFLSWNIFSPFSLFCVAIAAKYWDHALWCRDISRFNGNFRTLMFGN